MSTFTALIKKITGADGAAADNVAWLALDRAFRLGNRVLGNPEGAPGLECTLEGPALRFTAARTRR